MRAGAPQPRCRALGGLAAAEAFGHGAVAAAHVEQTPMPLRHAFADDLLEQHRRLENRPAARAEKTLAQFSERRRLAEFEEQFR
jgi:hypothetical protein